MAKVSVAQGGQGPSLPAATDGAYRCDCPWVLHFVLLGVGASDAWGRLFLGGVVSDYPTSGRHLQQGKTQVPEHLVIQSDNTVSQTKHTHVHIALAYLVAIKQFKARAIIISVLDSRTCVTPPIITFY